MSNISSFYSVTVILLFVYLDVGDWFGYGKLNAFCHVSASSFNIK